MVEDISQEQIKIRDKWKHFVERQAFASFIERYTPCQPINYYLEQKPIEQVGQFVDDRVLNEGRSSEEVFCGYLDFKGQPLFGTSVWRDQQMHPELHTLEEEFRVYIGCFESGPFNMVIEKGRGISFCFKADGSIKVKETSEQGLVFKYIQHESGQVLVVEKVAGKHEFSQEEDSLHGKKKVRLVTHIKEHYPKRLELSAGFTISFGTPRKVISDDLF